MAQPVMSRGVQHRVTILLELPFLRSEFAVGSAQHRPRNQRTTATVPVTTEGP